MCKINEDNLNFKTYFNTRNYTHNNSLDLIHTDHNIHSLIPNNKE